jgi:hypothetical protein
MLHPATGRLGEQEPDGKVDNLLPVLETLNLTIFCPEQANGGSTHL